MKIINREPSSFYSSDTDISILDMYKNPFYAASNFRKNITFNLPVGVFYTNNVLKRVAFKPYEDFKYPSLNYSPKDFKIVIAKNPNKLTINTLSKTIKVDPLIAENKFLPLLTFSIGHELGHLKYGGSTPSFDAEKACDDFSRNYMLSHGWNPTQINLAAQMLLRSFDRKNCIEKETVQKFNFR